jgi:glycosyltransferase involved in cell wall biosynthesis
MDEKMISWRWHFITGLGIGGAEQFLVRLVSGEEAASSVVISLSRGGALASDLKALGVPLIEGHWAKPFSFFAGLLRARRLHPPSVVVAWMYHAHLVATLLKPALFPSAKFGWGVCQSLENLAQAKPRTRRLVKALRFLSWVPDFALYNSFRARDDHRAIGYVAAERYLPNGFELPDLKLKSALRGAAFNEEGLPPDSIVVLHVARFHADKDQKNLLEALALVMRTDSRIVAILVGPGLTYDNSCLTNTIPERFRERIRLKGARRDVDRWYAAADLFVLSSAGEGFPTVIGEAMSWGVPCIATDVGDCASIVDSTGWIVPPRQPIALARTIETALACTVAETEKRSIAARYRVEKVYSIAAVRRTFREVFNIPGQEPQSAGQEANS